MYPLSNRSAFTSLPSSSFVRVIGFTHIAFELDDVDQALNNALKHGGELLGKITEKEVEGVGLLKFLYFRDPEGNIVEIQSWDK